MSTIKEVSRHARVSPATVSRVLNGTAPVTEETKRRVLAAIEELNYRPNVLARGLVTNRSGGIGVTVNDIASPFFGAILKGVETEVEAAGMHLLISSGQADVTKEKAAIEFLLERRCDALVVQVEKLSEYELLALAEGRVPVVVVGRVIAELEPRCVYLDNELGGELATAHLLANGHSDIAYVSGPLSFPDSRARLQGYRKVLEEAGIAYRDHFVVEADFREEGGYLATVRLLERKLGITAIFVANDQMAAGAFQALREAGLRIPEDISVVGYDDVFWARYLYPPLTTIRQPLREMGQAAARIALNSLQDGETEVVRRRFEPKLVIRQSVASI